MEVEKLTRIFEEQFDRRPALLVQAPGRVNLIGEHTDYNDGFVFPAAIDRYITCLAAPRDGMRIRVYSLDFDQRSEFAVRSDLEKDSVALWSNYIRGVVLQLLTRNFEPEGVDLVVSGNVPVGAGLSSSAALEVGAAETFRVLSGLDMGKPELALLSQDAENKFVGVQCGIMDQFVSVLAEEDHALFLDCRDLSYSMAPLPRDLKVVVCDSRVQRRLDGSEYNERRRQCEEAVRRLAEPLDGVRALRDVSLADLKAHQSLLDDLLYRRSHHVVSENRRVQKMVAALEEGRIQEVGKLLYESHESLRDDYEVSCRELDILVELAREAPGTIGARMTGAGFGGCTVNLVNATEVGQFCKFLRTGYSEEAGTEPHIYVCKASNGVTSSPIP